jgi:hypothetical protein
MATSKKDIGKLLRKYGYSMPKDIEEVESFEKKFKESYTAPKKWPDIEDIISGKKPESKIVSINETGNKSASNLAMAAREGKEISEKDRLQMDKDKKDARKK